MKMKLNNYSTWLVALAGSSLLSACTPNPNVLPERVQAGRPAAPATTYVQTRPAAPVVPVQKPAPVSRTLPLPKEPAPVVEVLQHRQGDSPVQQQGEPEVLEVKSSARYDASPAVRALIKQADTEIDQGKLATATATVERALRIESDNPDLWLKLSELHKRQGNDQQAASMASKAEYYQSQLR